MHSKFCIIYVASWLSVSSAYAQVVPAEDATQTLEVPDMHVQKDGITGMDERQTKIWKRKVYLTFGISSENLKNMTNAQGQSLESSLAMSLQWGKTFYLHKRPIAQLMKIGFDFNWIDLRYTQYRKWEAADIGLTITDDMLPHGRNQELYNNEKGPFDYDLINLGIGIGPTIHLAPFYQKHNGWAFLKGYTFFHVTPSASLLGFSRNGEKDAAGSLSFTTVYSWGIGLAYRSFAVGFSTHWGMCKYDVTDYYDRIYDTYMNGTELKHKYKATASTFNVSLRF